MPESANYLNHQVFPGCFISGFLSMKQFVEISGVVSLSLIINTLAYSKEKYGQFSIEG